MLTKILLTLSLITGISTIAVANSNKYDALQVNEIDSTSSKIVTQSPLPELENIAKTITVKVYAGEDRGSGILIAQKNNTYTVITNAHVTDRGDIYTIETSDGIKHNAVISDRQGTENDLAILKFNTNNAYQVAKLGDSKAITKDETVIAAGFPYDRDNLLITQGKISLLLDKPLAKGYQIGFSNETVQGMSGGLLLNAKGEVIGVLGKGKGALLEDSYNYQDGTSPTPESIEQMKDAGFSIPIANIAEISPQLASLLPSTDNPKTAQNPQTETAQKPEYTGIVGKVDAIAEQITVRIDNTQNNTNGSGVIVAKQGNTYYGITAKHVICGEISVPKCDPNGTHEIVTPDGKNYKLNYQTVEANQEWLDIAIFSFESINEYTIVSVGKYKPDDQWIFVSGFPQLKTKSDNEPTRLITGGTLKREEIEEFIIKETGSLTKSKGNDGLVYTNISYGGMSGGAVLDSEGRLIGINTGSEQELYEDEMGNYTKFNLGLSLGEAISDVFGYLETDKTKFEETWLTITKEPAKQLKDTEIKDVLSQLFNVKPPENNQDLSAWMNYGNQLWRFGRTSEAIEAFKNVITIDPQFDKAYYSMGLAYYSQQQWQQAVDSFTKAVGINSNPYYYWRYLGKSYNQSKMYEKAISVYEQAIVKNQSETTKDFVLYFELGDVFNAKKQYNQALTSFDNALTIKPRYPSIYKRRGDIYSKLEQYDPALSDYTTAVSINPQDTSAYFNRGSTYFKLKQYDRALLDFSKATDINPDDAYAHIGLSMVYSSIGDSVKAKESGEKAKLLFLEQNTELSKLAAMLSITQLHLAKFAQVEPKKQHNNTNTLIGRGNLYFQFAQYDKALADYSRAIALNPRLPQPYNNRGNTYLKLEQYDKAIADYNNAIALSPQTANTYNSRGNIYNHLGKYQKALADYSKVIELNLKNPDTYINRAIIYQKQQKFDLSLADYKSALKIKSNSLVAIINIGLIQYEMGAIAEAKKQFYQGLRENNKSAEIQLATAVTEYSQGNIEIALKLARTALKSNSKFGNPDFLREQLWGEKMIADTQKLLAEL